MSRQLFQPDDLRDENTFLRMKLMLERDAYFDALQQDIPPEIENMFLHGIIEFEKQADEAKRISVFEKIGSPRHFPMADAIPDAEMEVAWKSLYEYMRDYGVSLDASVDMSAAEMYRFATEEFFFEEITDINIPGMMTCFIYSGKGLE